MLFSQVFFRSGKLAFLEELNARDAAEMAPEIVAKITKWYLQASPGADVGASRRRCGGPLSYRRLRRKKLKRAIYSVYAFVKLAKRLRLLRAGRRFRRAAVVVTIIRLIFFPLARKVKRRRAAARLQALLRMAFERQLYCVAVRAAVAIQAQMRGRGTRRVYAPVLAERRQAREAAAAAAAAEAARMAAADREAAAAEVERKREEAMRKLREADERKEVNRSRARPPSSSASLSPASKRRDCCGGLGASLATSVSPPRLAFSSCGTACSLAGRRRSSVVVAAAAVVLPCGRSACGCRRSGSRDGGRKRRSANRTR
jgi:myosin heavy subunit